MPLGRLSLSGMRAEMLSPGRRHPSTSACARARPRSTGQGNATASPAGSHPRPQGAGRGRIHPGAPRQLLRGAGWVLAWARRRPDPPLSPAANAKSIRHVSAPRGNRLRPAEGSSQGRSRRLGGSAQGGRPGMCRAKAPSAADVLHPPPQPAPSCPALDPCPEVWGAPGGSAPEQTGSPLPPHAGSPILAPGSRSPPRSNVNGGGKAPGWPWG